MKTLIFAIALFACTYTCSAQTDTTKKQPSAEPDTSSFGAFRKVEFESEFPGGLEGWRDFLQKNLVYPKRAVRQRVEGVVVLEFIVCTDGTVCDIRAISGPEDLRASAVAALKNTPNWIPAKQDGRTVKSYKKQPIIYRLTRD